MNNKPKVSVIVPVYNVAQYLSECIDSILAQKYSNFELILVDDGSTDNSFEICKKYEKKDNRIVLIRQQNQGLVSAWKSGVNNSHGDFICFIDSDDKIQQNHLLDLIEAEQKFNVDLVEVPLIRFINNRLLPSRPKLSSGFYDEQKYKKIKPYLLSNGKFQSRLLSPSRCGKLIKRELVIKNMKYCDKNMTYGEDLSLIFPIFLDINSVCFLKNDNNAYLYRMRSDSMIHGYDKKRWESVKLVYHNLLTAMKDKNEPLDMTDQLYLDFYSALIDCYKNEVKKEHVKLSECNRLINEMRSEKIFTKSEVIKDKVKFNNVNKLILKCILKNRPMLNTSIFLSAKIAYKIKVLINEKH